MSRMGHKVISKSFLALFFAVSQFLKTFSVGMSNNYYFAQMVFFFASRKSQMDRLYGYVRSTNLYEIKKKKKNGI